MPADADRSMDIQTASVDCEHMALGSVLALSNTPHSNDELWSQMVCFSIASQEFATTIRSVAYACVIIRKLVLHLLAYRRYCDNADAWCHELFEHKPGVLIYKHSRNARRWVVCMLGHYDKRLIFIIIDDCRCSACIFCMLHLEKKHAAVTLRAESLQHCQTVRQRGARRNPAQKQTVTFTSKLQFVCCSSERTISATHDSPPLTAGLAIGTQASSGSVT